MQHIPAKRGEEATPTAGASFTAGHLCMCGSIPQLKCSSSTIQNGCHCVTACEHSFAHGTLCETTVARAVTSVSCYMWFPA